MSGPDRPDDPTRPLPDAGDGARTLVEDDITAEPGRAPAGPDDLLVIEDDPVVLADDDPDTFASDHDPDSDPALDPDGDPAVDPRMARRWIDQRRAEGRRRLRIGLGIVAFAAVALLAWVVAHSSLLGMDTVEVHGTGRVDAAAVRLAAAIDDGAPLLFLDDAAVARRVERLPGIASARVRTELPGTVVIDVVERDPVAWAAAPAPDDTALLDASGRVIARVAEPPTGLLRLEGVSAGAVGSRVAHADSLRQVGRLPVELRLMTDHVALTPRGGAVLVLRAGDHGAARVVLGDATRTAHKGAVALALLADLRARGEARDTVDVTVPDAPFVR